MASEDKEDGVLSRWSKRKRGIGEAEEAPELSGEELRQVDEARELELAANREAAEAIDLETIDEDSDLSLFLKEGVPQALKKAALAKLWKSSPVFANVDGLVDYDDNFADPNLIMKTFTSAYQVGKGYLKEIVEENPSEDSSSEEIQAAHGESNEAVEEDSPESVAAISDHENVDVSVDTETIPTETENDDELPPKPNKVPLRKRWDLA